TRAEYALSVRDLLGIDVDVAALLPPDTLSEGLMTFYDKGRKAGDFESGVRMSLQALLASPKFVFRFERAPASVKPGQTYLVSDLDLASRLSYFLWNTMPDQQLVNLAATVARIRLSSL